MRPLIHQSTDPTPPQPDPKAAAKKPSSEAAKTLKLALAIFGLLVGGALIAWNLGFFGTSGPPPAPERPASEAIKPVPPAANSEGAPTLPPASPAEPH